MRAAIATAYGSPEVIKFVDLPVPAVGAGDILVRIHAASVSSGDWRLRSGVVPAGLGVLVRLAMGLRKLRQPILGNDFSGVVEAVGGDVSRYRVGDAVFGSGGMRMGCHAEFRTFRETDSISAKPEHLSHREAAALPFGGQTALAFLRDKGKVKAGERVLVIGASGAVGCQAVQIARALGADVSAVTSIGNSDLVRSLGAATVIAHDRSDPLVQDRTYDVIVDTVGQHTYPALRHLLAERGRLLAIAAGLPDMLRSLVVNSVGRHRLLVGEAGESAALMADLAAMASSGAIRPVIDSVFPFPEIVAAHARVETRRKVGAVVVEMVPDDRG